MKLSRLMLTAFGLGHLRPASGTWGSMPPPAIALLFVWIAGANGFDGEMVDRVIRLVVRSQFKRQLPVIAKLSARSVGWDFRYPRDWLS